MDSLRRGGNKRTSLQDVRSSVPIRGSGNLSSSGAPQNIAFALAVLVAGALVYLAARPATTYIASPFQGIPLPEIEAGLISGCLPTFCHTFAFSLVIGETLRLWPWAARTSFVAWTSFEAIVEIAQIEPIARVFQAMLGWSFGNGSADFIAGYFLRSTFDHLDLLAAALGGRLAWIVYANKEWERRT